MKDRQLPSPSSALLRASGRGGACISHACQGQWDRHARRSGSSRDTSALGRLRLVISTRHRELEFKHVSRVPNWVCRFGGYPLWLVFKGNQKEKKGSVKITYTKNKTAWPNASKPRCQEAGCKPLENAILQSPRSKPSRAFLEVNSKKPRKYRTEGSEPSCLESPLIHFLLR